MTLERVKVTVKTRANYESQKKAKFTFNLSKLAIVRNALKLYYRENFTVYDRQKDVGHDAINLARCKVVRSMLKNDFQKKDLKKKT